MHHQLGGAHLRIGPRDRELHALVLPDRPAEHVALLGVGRRLVDEPLGVADALGGDQDALGVHAGEDVAEALALLADQVLGRHPQIVEEHLGGGVVHHRADRPDGQAVAHRLRMSTRKTDRPSVRFFDLVARRGAGEQQHQVGMLGAGGPDLLAVDDVACRRRARRGAERQRVGAARSARSRRRPAGAARRLAIFGR